MAARGLVASLLLLLREAVGLSGAPRTQRPAPHVVLLCGLPGSGKSTLAAAFRGLDWRVVSQDALGSRGACEGAVRKALRAGDKVLVDRCNHDPKQRAHWTKLYATYCDEEHWPPTGVDVVWLDVPLSECERRVMGRAAHPTLPPTEESRRVVRGFEAMFKAPKASEAGVRRVVRVDAAVLREHFSDVTALAKSLADAACDRSAGAPGKD
ncbi:AAA domain-containing protein [Pelagophyceae sp. CCMP2097]|nr:AAA domain-containing protein [Pelagophyceae sp. CCMP2097]|mmetsp:Transcript_9347/g.32804  ORF Transcript_9347/g.32804 Transcript_9347/m.32804 type:complete len:210 (+) Transcript_9347:33-662(+)